MPGVVTASAAVLKLDKLRGWGGGINIFLTALFITDEKIYLS